MQAVGRLGSYISQGVYTVSGPFHPFGGAVDIVVVQQQDGSFKSSPWYVRFGKFQGVLKSKEKIVQINVNDVDADLQMHLDNKGEAFFLREIDAETVLIDSIESGDGDGDDLDVQSLKSKSSNFGSEDGKIVGRTNSNSRRSRILGLMFGRRSLSGEFEDAIGNKERAEIAANLLDIKWSTNLDGENNGEADHAVVVENVDGSFGVAKVEKKLSGGEVSVVEDVEESSKVRMVRCLSKQTHEVMYLAHGESGEVHVHDQVLHSPVTQGTENEEVTKNADVVEVFEFHSQARRMDSSGSEASMYDVEDVEDLTTSPKPQTNNLDVGHCSSEKVESYCVDLTTSPEPQTNNLDIGHCSSEKVESYCVTNSSGYNSQDDQGLCENNMKDKNVSSTQPTPSHSLGDCLPSEISRRSLSPSLDEENFLFGDFDESGANDQFEGSLSPKYIDKEDDTSFESGTENSRVTSSPIVIPRNEVGRHIGSLPNISSGGNSMCQHVRYPLSQSLDSTFPGKDNLECLKLDEYKEKQLPNEQADAKDCQDSDELKDTALNVPPGGTSTGNWRIWPFSLSSSVSRESLPPIPNNAKNTSFGNSSENKIFTDVNKIDSKPNLTTKIVRETTPTSEEIASLNLKEGRNIVTFTFSTAMLGKQQVDAQIYLWKWNDRIVISDVDGTITKSDVLGQFMPLVGVDWSQTGVAHLFSAVKENGYQLLFLSARSISQAYITRQFLLNLKQDGKILPEGPVVISPDGLFPSLYREVIRRVPHEFKIACLESIKALFPSDCNPFYAGFGNRDTDEISYLKVGIPLGKIFIINPRGEIVVNRSIDTKSYTSMHALVNGMFPPTGSSEQEDFNSWNFWKLPPSAIDI
ncbi:unnamed protein product [Lathyrus oleraceus]|uniref:LNS2/PITP domain-containing protein n=1 Tax=Pisum sativum TaxID=3888 RepID=A0A9D4WMJ2_PEA|nr:phosphatidate phosphatase PAH2-like [Pisum sativum]KAI5404344.1 hypothetical protein KIW84_051487 [Pisum sativum]